MAEQYAIGILIIIGLIFNTLGAISLYRFPDVYTRLHGATKCTTIGSIFTSLAVVVYAAFRLHQGGESRFAVLIIHALVAVMVLLVTNATGAHAIARAAHRSGVVPKMAVVDRLAEEEERKGGVVSE